MLGDLLQDLRVDARSLLRRPHAGIAPAVAAMAFGIGAAVAIFSVVNAVLLKPLPYPGADRVVAVWNHFTQLSLPRMALSEPELADYREGSASLQELAAINVAEGNLSGLGGDAERVRLASVSPSLFPILGIEPSRGRVFAESEDRSGSPFLAVLSDAFWRRRLGGDPQALGRDLVLNGNRHTIVGIMPPGFRYPERVDVWIPLRVDPPMAPRSDRGNHYLRALARLRPGVGLPEAEAELQAVARRMQQSSPDAYPSDSGWGVSLTPFQVELTGDVRPALLVLCGGVGLVLLISCANVANLQLERALARSRDTALRAALGEPRGRLIRRAVVDSLGVTLAGGGLGVGFAAVAVRHLTGIDPAAIPRAYDIALDGRVLLFAVLLAVATGLMVALVPVLQASRLSLTETLKEGGEKSVGGRGRRRVRRGLVALEVALALVVAVGAGLLARTFAHLRRVDPGFDAGRTLTLQVALPEIRYSDAQASAFFQRLVEGVAALPGVRHAGVVDCLPLSGCEISGSYYLEERMPAAGSMPPEGDMTFVSPDYFRAMGIPLRQGRLFAAEDRVRGRGTAGAVIVDEDLARRSWPGESPIGKRLKFEKDLPWQTVVGVVGHVQNALDSSSREQVYIPLAEVPLYPVNAAFLVVRTDVPPAALVDPVRELVKGLDAELPIFDVQTISDRLALSLAPRQLSMSLLLSLAILALFLSAVGVYGVIACSVTERVREIGLRMALGARSRDILALVVGEGLVMALGGVAAGLGIACGATKLLGSLLFGVSATDPATYLATSILLVATVVAASYLPARRATRLSPTQAFGGS